ncbi:MAG: hypothetical protein PVH61_10520 [Candidatus Aminicenantes bacterium]
MMNDEESGGENLEERSLVIGHWSLVAAWGHGYLNPPSKKNENLLRVTCFTVAGIRGRP